MHDIQLEQILLQALDTPHGLVVSTTDPQLLKQKLYVIRSKARKEGNLAYDSLSFRTSPINPDTELWISVGEKKDGPTETTA